MTRRRRGVTHSASWTRTHTDCGRDLNPSAGLSGSHSSVPVLSSVPTCRACRRATAAAARRAAGHSEALAIAPAEAPGGCPDCRRNPREE